MNEPLLAGASEGQYIPQVDLDAMLDEYYRARGGTLLPAPRPARSSKNLASRQLRRTWA